MGIPFVDKQGRFVTPPVEQTAPKPPAEDTFSGQVDTPDTINQRLFSDSQVQQVRRLNELVAQQPDAFSDEQKQKVQRLNQLIAQFGQSQLEVNEKDFFDSMKEGAFEFLTTPASKHGPYAVSPLQLIEPLVASLEIFPELVRSRIQKSFDLYNEIANDTFDVGDVIDYFNPAEPVKTIYNSFKAIGRPGSVFGELTGGEGAQPFFTFLPEMFEKQGIPEGFTIPEEVPVLGGVTLRGMVGFLGEIALPSIPLTKGKAFAEAFGATSKMENSVGAAKVSAKAMGVTAEEATALKDVTDVMEHVISKGGKDVTERANAIAQQLDELERVRRTELGKKGLKEDYGELESLERTVAQRGARDPAVETPPVTPTGAGEAQASAQVFEEAGRIADIDFLKTRAAYEQLTERLAKEQAAAEQLAEETVGATLQRPSFDDLSSADKKAITKKAINTPVFSDVKRKLERGKLLNQLDEAVNKGNAEEVARLQDEISKLDRQVELENEFAQKFAQRAKERTEQMESDLRRLDEVGEKMRRDVGRARRIDVVNRDVHAPASTRLQVLDAAPTPETNFATRLNQTFINHFGEDVLKGMTFKEANNAFTLDNAVSSTILNTEDAVKIATGDKTVAQIAAEYGKKAVNEDIGSQKAIDDLDQLMNSSEEVFKVAGDRESVMQAFEASVEEESLRLLQEAQELTKAAKKKPKKKPEQVVGAKEVVDDTVPGTPKKVTNKPKVKAKVNRIGRLMRKNDIDVADLEDVAGQYKDFRQMPESLMDDIIDRLENIDDSWTASEKRKWLLDGVSPSDTPPGGLGAPPAAYGGEVSGIRKAWNSVNIKFFQTVETTLRKMGPVGNELADRYLTMYFRMARRTSIDLAAVRGIVKAVTKSGGSMRKIVASMENPDLVSGLTDVERATRDALSSLITRYGDEADRVGILKNRVRNYFPHVHNYNWARGRRKMKDIENRLAEKIAKRDNISMDEAVELARVEIDNIKRFKTTERRHLQIELERQFDAPGWLADPTNKISERAYNKEFLMSMEQYIANAQRRFAEEDLFKESGKSFDPRFRTVDELIRSVPEADDRVLLNDIHNRVLGLDKRNPEAAIMSTLKNLQVLDKLDYAMIPNSMQTLLTTVPKTAQLGFIRQVQILSQATASLLSRNGKRFAKEAGVVTEETIKDIVGMSQGVVGTGNLARKYLKGTGFTATERLNNIYAAHVGKYYFKAAVDLVSGKKSPLSLTGRGSARRIDIAKKELLKMGLSEDQVKRIAKGQTDFIGEEEIAEAAWNIARKTQFRGKPIDLPLFASSDYGRLIYQFKTFAINMTKLAKDEFVKPAMKFVTSRGKEGTILPMMEFAVGTQVIGEIHGGVRSWLTGRERAKDGLERVVENVMWAGALGILMDAVQAARRGNPAALFQMVGGPTIAQGIEAIAATGGLTVKAMRDGLTDEEVIEWLNQKMVDRIPFSEVVNREEGVLREPEQNILPPGLR